MAQGCFGKCTKFMLFAFNFLFLLCSIALVVIGGLGMYYMHKAGYAMGENFISAPIILIAIGSVVLVLAFLGCCGAATESYCMLMSFAVLLVVLFVAEIVVGVLVYTNRQHAKEVISENLQKTMADYWKKIKMNSARAAWDFVQTNLECCGVDGPADWANRGGVPPSCQRYTKGCIDAIEEEIVKFSLYIMAIIFILAAIQLFAVCLACILANQGGK